MNYRSTAYIEFGIRIAESGRAGIDKARTIGRSQLTLESGFEILTSHDMHKYIDITLAIAMCCDECYACS